MKSDPYVDAEDKNEYAPENIFWFSKEAWWSHLQNNAKQPTIGKQIDDAMDALEKQNTSIEFAAIRDTLLPILLSGEIQIQKCRTISENNYMKISNSTKLTIIDRLCLEEVVWNGSLTEIQFIERLLDLKKLPSNDPRFKNAAEDIFQHTVAYGNRDWGENWIYNYPGLNLRYGDDEVFLNFLCQMVHPVVRPSSDEAIKLVNLFNEHLASDGWEIVAKFYVKEAPVFAARQVILIPVNTLQPVANRLNTEYISRQVTRMEASIYSAPDLAIGTAKEFLETICKTILDEHNIDYESKKPDLTQLVRLTLKTLKLVRENVPEHTQGAETIRNLLSNLATISNYLAELRNPYGTGHGKDAYFQGLQPRHARLAVGAASTLGVFLFETHSETSPTLF